MQKQSNLSWSGKNNFKKLAINNVGLLENSYSFSQRKQVSQTCFT